MAIRRNETLGKITQAIMALRDEVHMTPESMTKTIEEYEVGWKLLQENRGFVEGVWSGFTWPPVLEAMFWRQLIVYKDVEVVAVEEIAEIPKENLVTA